MVATVTVLSGGVAGVSPVTGTLRGGIVIVSVTSTHWFWYSLNAIHWGPTTKYSLA
jgi:hypothetical protein